MPNYKKRKLRRSVRILRGLYITLVVLAALFVVGFAVYKLAAPAPEIPAAPQETLEVTTAPGYTEAGSYQRKELTYTFLLACSDQESGNADTIMVVQYDVANQKVGILSIPRDTLIKRSTPKINSTYHGGVEELQAAVSDLLGIPLDFYLTVDIDAFIAIVDAVDGVDFDVPVTMYYDDPAQDLHIHYLPGVQHLSGQQAMEVCRFRHNADGTGYPMGDVQRAETQQKLMVTIAKEIVSWSSISKVSQFMDIFERYVDTNLTGSNLAYFAGQALNLNLNTGVSRGTLPGDGTVTYRGTKYCYELFPEESLTLVNSLVNPYTTPLTQADLNIFQAP